MFLFLVPSLPGEPMPKKSSCTVFVTRLGQTIFRVDLGSPAFSLHLPRRMARAFVPPGLLPSNVGVSDWIALSALEIIRHERASARSMSGFCKQIPILESVLDDAQASAFRYSVNVQWQMECSSTINTVSSETRLLAPQQTLDSEHEPAILHQRATTFSLVHHTNAVLLVSAISAVSPGPSLCVIIVCFPAVLCTA